MFTSTSRKKNKSNLSSAAQPIGKSRKSNNQSSLNGNLNIQAKLTVGQPNDKYEQEADSVAGQVMSMPVNDTVQRSCSSCGEEENTLQTKPLYSQISPLIQRQSIEEEEIQTKPLIQRQPVEEEELIQAKTASGATSEVTPTISSGIQSLQGAGRPLSRSERGFFEPRFGTDFSNVRVHNNTRATNMARSVNARAFTLGHNVVFGAGEYSPENTGGRSLLAHELAHVVQQGNSRHLGAGSKVQTLRSESPTDKEFLCNGTAYPSAEVWFSHPVLAHIRAGETLMAYGSNGDSVALVQQTVVAWGCDHGFNNILPNFGVDGLFRSETRSAVRTFQRRQLIRDDGIVGPITMGELDRFVPGGQQVCPSGTQPSTFVAASESGPMQTMCIPPGTQPLSKRCPCGCPLPAPSGANPAVGDICKVLKNATSVDDNNNLFCPDEDDPVKVTGKNPVHFLEVELLNHSNKPVRIQKNFVKNGAPLSITPETRFTAPDGSGKNRTDVGVGEMVDLTGSLKGNWSAADGTPKSGKNVNPFVWTAPNRAKTVTITLSKGSATTSIDLKVREPASITADKIREINIPAGTAGAGMKLRFNYHPKNVSFGNVESKEVSGPASQIKGYYKKNYKKKDLKHDSKDIFIDIRQDNKDNAIDTAKDIRKKKPYEFGTYAWVIPNNFKVKTESGNGKKFTEVTQFFHMVNDTGKMRVLKAGAIVERSP